MVRYEILIENTRETYVCDEEHSLLYGMEALARRGIPVGCRGGGCGVCKVRIEKGSVRTQKMSRAHVTQDEQANGYVLACRAFPQSDVCLSALDKLALSVERGYVRPGIPDAAATRSR